MVYKVKPGQVSYGEPIGILVIENYVPFIPGDVANASSYGFPVRFQRLPGTTPDRLFNHDASLYDSVLSASRELVKEGVRAITGDCGFLAIFQNQLVEELGIPVFLSSLLQLDFIDRIVGARGKTGVVTANADALDRTVLDAVTNVSRDRLVVAGLEAKPSFDAAVILEAGELDEDAIRQEVIEAALATTADPAVRAILLECSLLPPYSAAVQEATGLPVFDYNTMINYVYSTVVRFEFEGIM